MKKKDIKQSIKQKEEQLAKLKLHVDKSETCSTIYNKVVLEKAILKKEIEEAKKNPIIEKIKGLVPNKKKNISDYFRSK